MGAENAVAEFCLIAREQSDFGGTFTFGSITGPCSVGTLAYGGRLVAGGISPHAEITIVIRKCILKDAPKSNKLITVATSDGDQALKIAADGITDGGSFWEIICNSANERA